MRRLAAACVASVLLYATLFGCVLDRRLDEGFLRSLIEAKLARGAAAGTPKLVILAGSNALYSHRCATIEPILHLPCVNAGVAVGIGLDYLFARWREVLRPGDVLYLPMEIAQYTRGRLATATGPDAAIMFRHDRATLAGLGPARMVAALFAFDMRAAVVSVAEAALSAAGMSDPRGATGIEVNAWGDRTGHSVALAAATRGFILHLPPSGTTATAITAGYGTSLIAAFVRDETARGVRVIGGLPTGFADDAPGPDVVAAIRRIYVGNGGAFLTLPNASRYPRTDFFDTADHLTEPCQIHHSIMLAGALATLLQRRAAAYPDDPPCADTAGTDMALNAPPVRVPVRAR